jgi:hypothetical protein
VIVNTHGRTTIKKNMRAMFMLHALSLPLPLYILFRIEQQYELVCGCHFCVCLTKMWTYFLYRMHNTVFILPPFVLFYTFICLVLFKDSISKSHKFLILP